MLDKRLKIMYNININKNLISLVPDIKGCKIGRNS